MTTTNVSTLSPVTAAERAVAHAADAAEATGRIVIHNLGEAGELWVLPAIRIELTNSKHMDLPLRYQFTPRFGGMARLLTKDEAIALVEKEG